MIVGKLEKKAVFSKKKVSHVIQEKVQQEKMSIYKMDWMSEKTRSLSLNVKNFSKNIFL